jgi:DNA-binding transcriptional MerR regulator
MATTADNTKLLPIGVVSERTGVNSVTLRAWERRYGLVKPLRTTSGRRLYSEDDVRLIEEVLAHLDSGMPISSAARSVAREGTAEETAPDVWQGYLRAMIDAIEHFDETVLDAVYNEAMSLYPVDVVTARMVVPLLRALGERWNGGLEGGIAEEHFFSVFMRNKLGARFHHRNIRNNGPRMVAACLPGETHEFGLLLFALSAHARGFRLVLLGSDMPLHELPVVLRRTGSDGIVLSGSVNAHCMELALQVGGLTRAVDVPVFIGGDVSDKCTPAIRDAGGIPVGTDPAKGIRLIRSTLSAHRQHIMSEEKQ